MGTKNLQCNVKEWFNKQDVSYPVRIPQIYLQDRSQNAKQCQTQTANLFFFSTFTLQRTDRMILGENNC